MFEAAGYRVVFCLNLTDVDDKIIRDSQKTLPADADNETRLHAMRAFTDTYERAFLEDIDALRIARPTLMPRATDHMADMIRLIQALEVRGLAYERDGSVYYRVGALPQYGCLSHIDREGMQLGTSVDADEYDRDAVSDFVLWKGAKPGEPWWESPWGPGRPGWHIECSAMALNLLGERLDLHTGGVDLVFPHHENEIAQSEGAIGHQWVSHWVHGEFLMVEGQKMSKSLGNFFTLRDLVAKGVDPMTFRFAIQSNHYRKLYNFSFEGVRAAEATLERLRTFRSRMEEPPALAREGASDPAVDAGATPGARARRVLAGHRRRPEHARGAGRDPHARHRPQRAGRLPAAHARGTRRRRGVRRRDEPHLRDMAPRGAAGARRRRRGADRGAPRGQGGQELEGGGPPA